MKNKMKRIKSDVKNCFKENPKAYKKRQNLQTETWNK